MFALEVITTDVERSVNETGFVLLESVVPVFLVCEYVIQDAGVPFSAGSEDHVWELIVLSVSVGGHLHINESIDDVEWDDVTFQSADVLDTSDLHRTIVHSILVVLDLSTGMYGAVSTMISVLL